MRISSGKGDGGKTSGSTTISALVEFLVLRPNVSIEVSFADASLQIELWREGFVIGSMHFEHIPKFRGASFTASKDCGRGLVGWIII